MTLRPLYLIDQMTLLKRMFMAWLANSPSCAQCEGRGPDCKCPDAPLTPTQSFELYCELYPWAPECKIYED